MCFWIYKVFEDILFLWIAFSLIFKKLHSTEKKNVNNNKIIEKIIKVTNLTLLAMKIRICGFPFVEIKEYPLTL